MIFKKLTTIVLLVTFTSLPLSKLFANEELNKRNSLSAVLNPDGSLEKGISGSFDASGFALSYAKDGSPLFKQLNTQDNWNNEASNGVGFTVNAVATNGTDIYVGASNVYKWNGTSWSIVGGGIPGVIRALEYSNGVLYAGGAFTTAGGLPAKNIAKWNGTIWSSLGIGTDSTVFALAVSGTNVYAGGAFSNAGGISANKIAKWDGSNWSSLGSGVNRDVHCMYTYGSDLYIGGNFTIAGGNNALRIAKWNGVSWTALGTGMDSTVLTIAVTGGIVYAGGVFTTAGGLSANQIARWNGSVWSPMETGLPARDYVTSMIVHLGTIYASYIKPNFTDGINFSGVFKWTGTSWENTLAGQNTNINGYVNDIAFCNNDVVAVGSFQKAGDVFALNVARQNSGAWVSLGSAIDNEVSAIGVNGNDIYITGVFSSAGGIRANNIARWNGNSWSAVGVPVVTGYFMSSIDCILVNGTDIYVSGNFSGIGGITASGIAKWNGTTWSALGSGISGEFRSLAWYNGELYAAGYYSIPGNTGNGIIKWNGSTWSTFGQPFSSSDFISTMYVNGNDLYVAGRFSSIDGVTVNNIAKWNGTSWSALGTGITGNATVYAVHVAGIDVYVAGSFTTAGSITVNNIAKWNGTAWSSLGSGVNNVIYTIAADGSDIYVGGFLSEAGGIAVKGIAKWDGSAWSAIGSGVDGKVNKIVSSSGKLYIGGFFSKAGDKPAPHFAILDKSVLPVTCIDFSYQRNQENHVTLIWSTAHENNNDHFSLERSFDGVRFMPVATISSAASGKYEFSDNLNGNTNAIIYYRLKQVDKNGKSEYVCKILQVKNQLQDIVNLYPNPVNDLLIVDNLDADELVVMDQSGRSLLQRKVRGSTITIDTKQLSAGLYFLRLVKKDGSVLVKPFTKL